jgi:hypothetical protein
MGVPQVARNSDFAQASVLKKESSVNIVNRIDWFVRLEHWLDISIGIWNSDIRALLK